MRMHEGLPRARKPGKPAPRTDGGGEPRKDN
jgi:hypothetical protein